MKLIVKTGMSWLWAVELIPLSIRGPANALVCQRPISILKSSRSILTVQPGDCCQLARQLLCRHHMPGHVHQHHL